MSYGAPQYPDPFLDPLAVEQLLPVNSKNTYSSKPIYGVAAPTTSSMYQQDPMMLGYPPQQQQQTAPIQAGYYAAPSSSQPQQQPLVGQQSRDHYDFANYDDSILQEEKELGPMKANWQFYTDMLLAAWVLFNSVTTIMIIVQNFKRTVNPYDRIMYGEKTFDTVITILTYVPMIFFVLVVFLFNNSYSERVFYRFLRKCAIIDFPSSGSPKQLVTGLRPVLFLLVWLAYLLFGIGVMIKFKATIGTIFTFINNMAVGVFLFWYRQQSIESKFISLSDFVQAFPNASNTHGDIDTTSLQRAARFVEKLALLESKEPSYGDFMRLYTWKAEQYSSMAVVCHHFSVWIIILSMTGAAFAYFFILQGIELKALWTNQVEPCVSVCTAAFSNATAGAPGWAMSVLDQCNFCTCKCLGALQEQDPSVLKACALPNTICAANNFCSSLTTCPGWK